MKNTLPVKANNSAPVLQVMQAAWNFFRHGLLLDAESTCHEILQSQPKLPDALHLLGAIALQQGKAKEAVDFISQAIRHNAKNPEYFGNLGLAYHEQGLLDEAVKQYQRAIAIAPSYSDAQYNLHAALLTAGDVRPAITCLQRVLTINPRDMDARFMLGVLHDYSGQVNSAIEKFETVRTSSAIYQARYDAWQYLKAQFAKSGNAELLPIMGSGVQTFKHAIKSAKKTGMVLEFGVRFGTSIRVIAGLLEQDIHGFDSFEGLPDEWHHEPKGSYTTKGVIPTVPSNVTLHVGWFEDTLPKFLSENSGPVRLINVDCDIYSSTKTVLDLLAPRIVEGTVIVFEEYIGNEHLREDEFKAFQEAVLKNGWQYEYLCFSFFTKQVAVRITKV
ncbi:MAG: tetratricopeptide repeat protein [Candidatus Methylopumilus sp.]